MQNRVPLLLLPGLLCDEALWANQMESLADIADCQVTDMTRDTIMSGMAKRILDEAPEHFALCGLSMGGYCALEIIRQAPHRVDRLALLDTSPYADTEERKERRRKHEALAEAGRFEDILEELLPNFIHPDRVKQGPYMEIIRASAENIGPQAFVRQLHALMSRADSYELLADIRCPTLVMCGREDALTPLALHEEMASVIPDARLVVVEDCGHLTPLEQPDVATPALRDWLLS